MLSRLDRNRIELFDRSTLRRSASAFFYGCFSTVARVLSAKRCKTTLHVCEIA
jgi:hypothetical protein